MDPVFLLLIIVVAVAVITLASIASRKKCAVCNNAIIKSDDCAVCGAPLNGTKVGWRHKAGTAPADKHRGVPIGWHHTRPTQDGHQAAPK